MANNLGKLAGKVDKARLGNTIANNIPPPPQFKPFVPPFSPSDPRALKYELDYDYPPHMLGDLQRQQMLALQQGEEIYNFENRPLANYGMQGASGRIVRMPFDLQNTRGGQYARNGFDSVLNKPSYDTISVLGEKDRLGEDVIAIMKSGDVESLKHEATHRALNKLRRLEGETEGRTSPRYSLLKNNLNEEDVVKFLDYINGDHVDTVEWYFTESGRWKNRNTGTFEEFIKEKLTDPGVMELLMTVQQFAAEELKKQGINSPSHFSDVLK